MVDQHFIPMSALKGDNLVDHSPNMPWYEGSTLMHHLENVHIASRPQPDRLPLPGAVRQPAEPRLPRLLRHGRLGPHPQGRDGDGAPLAEDQPREVDRHLRRRAGRSVRAAVGHAHARPTRSTSAAATCSCGRTTCRRSADAFDATIVWMTEEPLVARQAVLVQAGVEDWPPARSAICATASTSTRSTAQERRQLGLNEIGRCQVRLNQPIAFDGYRQQQRHRRVHRHRPHDERHRRRRA